MGRRWTGVDNQVDDGVARGTMLFSSSGRVRFSNTVRQMSAGKKRGCKALREVSYVTCLFAPCLYNYDKHSNTTFRTFLREPHPLLRLPTSHLIRGRQWANISKSNQGNG